MKRRNFIQSATVFTALSYNRILGSSERINMGIIDAGARGRGLWQLFLKQPDVTPVAVCDLHPNLNRNSGKAQAFRTSSGTAAASRNEGYRSLQ
ncbi:MAG: hypothetical protein ACRD2L_19405 [Terriglobia bacterium]